MGSRFQITLVDKDSISAEQNIDKAIAEITRIENLISEWRPETQISQVNQNAGIKPIKVDKEVFDLTKRAYTFPNLQTELSISVLWQWTKSGSLTILWMNFQVNRRLKNR
jgi:thiamine biosynthesis lipoprotein ApbE